MNLKKIIFLLISILISVAGYSQLIIESVEGMTPKEVVEKYLLGEGITVKNVRFNGSTAPIGPGGQIAVFKTGDNNSGLGFERGIILSTGKAENVYGPNNVDGKTTNYGVKIGDPTLDSVLEDLRPGENLKTFDPAVLEFDFESISEDITFEYVFASEEYPEYVNSFNDIFGFFVDGQGYPLPVAVKRKNIALIPGKTTPIMIDSVNYGKSNWFYYPDAPKGVNIEYYRSNPRESEKDKYGVAVGQTPLNTYIQADGLTTVLTAHTKLMPCNNKSIMKLAIADVKDGSWDSWVFIKANSFKAKYPEIEFKDTTGKIIQKDTILIRGCKNSRFDLKWEAFNDVARSLDVEYAGTAVKDVDFKVTMRDANNTIGNDYQFSFLPNKTFASIEIEALPSADTTTKIIEVIINSNLCNKEKIDTLRFVIMSYVAPQITLLGDTAICQSSLPIQLPFYVNATGPSGIQYNYEWENGDALQSVVLNYTDTISSVYKVKVSDYCKIYEDSIIITVIPLMNTKVSATNQKVCKGGAVDISVNVTGPTSGITYAWELANVDPAISSIANVDNFTVSPTINNNYVVTVQNSYSCIQKDSIRIDVYDPKVNIGKDTAFCEPNSITLRAPDNYNYKWNNGNVSQFITVSSTGDYWVEIEDIASGCKAVDTINITVNPLPTVLAATNINIICPGDTVRLTATGANTYNWTCEESDISIVGQEKDSIIFATPFHDNVYTVEGTTIHGCKGQSTVIISVKPRPVADFQVYPNPVLQLEPVVHFKNKTVDAVKYLWDLGDGVTSDRKEFVYTYSTKDTGTYLVTLLVEGAGGCTDTAFQYVYVMPDVAIYIPNAFIPDIDDPKLNTFKVFGLNLIKGFEFSIFDRWGKQIFFTKDSNEGWDGTYRGEKATGGVYTYLVKYIDAYGHPQTKKGTLTLIR